ncbi:MAG: araC-like ligand binding domain protein [Rhodocyclales bacterium]|nr:araC-like ligand binding domain protein [Rhodocyclales bacterium]
MIETLLGGMKPQQFLDEYWQKKPLLVRNAVPDFQGLLTPAQTRQLAADEDVESRLVFPTHDGKGGGWQLLSGPLRKRDFPKSGAWTVLVQGLNLLLDEADELLRQFAFIPFTRLDDLMVSYATDGGGVGPHFDSYDVFLLQGLGQRRWQVSAQKDLALVEGAPLRILKNFKSSHEWILDAGDMLYLPPKYAHNGVAIGECMTYSIGFRAPSARELSSAFLAFLEEKLALEGLYADPDLRATPTPARIPDEMAERVAEMLSRIRWAQRDVTEFLGQYLSEPKPHVFFEAPHEELSPSAFKRATLARGIRLDLRTQMLYATGKFFLNGEVVVIPANDARAFRRLANERTLTQLKELSEQGWELLANWYADGFIHLQCTV